MSDGAQQTAASYRYDAYGRSLLLSGGAQAAQPYRFSTKEHHVSSGLVDYGYRFYSPGMGRWLNRDPIQETGGLNLYGFVHNSPTNALDADGRFGFWGAGIGALLGGLTGLYTAGIPGLIGGVVGGIIGGFSGNPVLVSAIANVVQSIVQDLLQSMSDSCDPFFSVQTLVNAIISGVMGALLGGLAGASDEVVTAGKELEKQFGDELITGLTSGLNSTIASLAQAYSNLFSPSAPLPCG